MLYDQNQVQIGVGLEPEVVANCDTYAKYRSQSRFRFINEALKLYIKHAGKHCELLAEHEKNELNSHGHTEEALAA
jgi:metal-responsive CopG/Arc/MetJ family transcriptional regulator